MTPVVVQRDRWLFGDARRARLYDNGKSCILGHIARGLGAHIDVIRTLDMALDLCGKHFPRSGKVNGLFGPPSGEAKNYYRSAADQLTDVNDRPAVQFRRHVPLLPEDLQRLAIKSPEFAREEWLTRIAAAHNIQLTFVGGRP